METSILIAKLMGPIVLVAAIAMIKDTEDIQAMAREFLESRSLIYVSGILAMLGGLAIVNTHNTWVVGWPVLITIFGWAMIIGGTIRIALPIAVRSIGEAMLAGPTMIRLAGAGWLLIGIVLTYNAYF